MSIKGQFEFIECDSCRKRPVTNTLCEGCQHNQNAILTLRDRLLGPEIDKLFMMIDRCSDQVKQRLKGAAVQGKTGWDRDYPTNKLVEEIQEDLDRSREWMGRREPNKTILLLVDIIARCMFLIYRCERKTW